MDLLPLAVVLPSGLIRSEWASFAEAVRICWPAEVEIREALPRPDWEGIVLTEASALLPWLRRLPPEGAELLAARSVVRVSSHAAALRLLEERLLLGLIPGDAWYYWIFPEPGQPSTIYGYQDIAEPLPIERLPVTGHPVYGRFQSAKRTLPELVTDYLRTALEG